MTKLLWSGLLVLLMLSGCGYNGTPTRQNDFTPLTSIQVIPASPSVAASKKIAAKTSTRLTVIGNFSGLFTRDITDQAVWSSDTPAVAGFTSTAQPNRVSGLASGTAVLTATVSGISGNFTLTVSPATISTLALTPLAPSLPKGLNTQFTVSGVFSDTTTQDLTFDATWTSSAPAVATVGDAATNKGLAQALTVGTTTITAAFDGTNATTLMTVTEPVLQSISVSPSSTSILSLSTATFTASGSYSDGTTVDLTSLVSWTSSNTTIATIATTGTATALAQGTTSISATLSGVSGTSTLKVTGGTLTAITLSTPKTTLVKDTVARITATGTFSNGTTRDITRFVDWTTANSATATVTTPTPRDNLAWLNAVALTTGTAITAKYGTINTILNLVVTAPLLNSITISPDILNMTTGTSDHLSVIASYSDSTTQDVTYNTGWTTANSATATVGDLGIDKGKVTSVAAGTTNITASFGGLSAIRAVTVTTRTIKSLAISGVTTLTAGNQVKYTATATYTDNSTRDVTEKTTWTSSNQSVAILADSTNQPGQIIGVDSGSATLTATFGGISQTATITVP